MTPADRDRGTVVSIDRRQPPVVDRGRAAWYVGGILGLGGCFLLAAGAAVAYLARTGHGLGWPASLGLALLGMVLATPLLMWLARDLVHVLLYAVLPAPHPPRELDLPGTGLPPELATCVVYPVIVHDESDVDALLETMHATRNTGGAGPLAHVALVDFGDSPTQHHEHDARLWQAIESRITAANGIGQAAPMAALVRQRRFNPSEQCWLGWERKRGKLMEFLDLVSGDQVSTSFVLDRAADQALVARLRGLRYVVTLDVGSRFSPGGVRRLVATAAHPDNRAVLDEPNELVVHGFGLIRGHQALRIADTVFSWAMYSGPPAKPAPSIGQQLLGHDVFFGQGIVDVEAVRTTLAGRIPENSVLSHDKIEALHTGAACQTQVVLFDQTPPDYLTFRRRYHRWIRGDFHLLPWIVGRGSGPAGPGRRSLSPLGRWLLFEDMLGHSHSVSTVAVLILGWLLAPGPYVGIWTLVVLSLLVESVVTDPLTFLVRRRQPAPDNASRLTIVTRAVGAELVRWTLWTVLLADRALLTTDAAARALYRTLVSHRNVLQWTSFARSSRRAGAGWQVWWVEMWPGPALALATTLVVTLVNPAALGFAALLLVAWLLGPLVGRWVSTPRRWLAEPPA